MLKYWKNHFFCTLKSKKVLFGILIFITFSILYFYIGRTFFASNPALLNGNNHLFELDVPRVIGDMAITDFDHYRTSVHPLFVLFVNPIGSTLGKMIQPHQAARLLNSAFGGLSVVLFFFFATYYGLTIKRALLASVFFGLSASQLLLSAIPDVSSLATVSLLLMTIVFFTSLKKKEYRIWLWVLMGIFTLGITITNFIQTLICFTIVLHFSRKKNIDKLRDFILFLVGTLFFSAMLALIQKVIYPSSTFFINGDLFVSEVKWASTLLFHKPGRVLVEEIRNFFLINILSPAPVVKLMGGINLPYLSFQESWQFSGIGWIAIALWIVFLIYSVICLLKTKKNLPFFLGLALCFLFNFLLHSVYGISTNGIDLFIYTGYFTYILCLICLEGYQSSSRKIEVFVLILLTLVSTNNITQIDDMETAISFYSSRNDTNFQAEIASNSMLTEYQEELDLLRSHFAVKEIPEKRFFLFGMGNREKMLYRNGSLVSLPTGKVLYSWDIKEEMINPPGYEVQVTTINGNLISIKEDEVGVWLIEDEQQTLLSAGDLQLPKFTEHPYDLTLRVLLHEILINIDNGEPLPNFLIYSEPWYRDAAIVSMVLEKTNNIELIRDWILNIDEPYDKNNGVEEPDNLGELLYMLSLVSDDSHPLVADILHEAEKIRKDDYIIGLTDSELHPVYQTAWLKFGLTALGMEDTFQLPVIDDSYAHLLWWYPSYDPTDLNTPGFSDHYPYLLYAASHTNRTDEYVLINSSTYPLSWEIKAAEADYQRMRVVSNKYRSDQIGSPHSWASAELFLYLYMNY